MRSLLLIFSLMAGVALLFTSCAAPPDYTDKNFGSGSVVAVWDLENYSITQNPNLENLQEFLSAKISETLAEEGDLIVVERQKLLLALEELHLSSTELTDESTRLQIGKMVGAQFMIFGGCQQAGDTLRIDLRLVDVERGTVLRTGKLTTTAVEPAALLSAAEEVAKKLL